MQRHGHRPRHTLCVAPARRLGTGAATRALPTGTTTAASRAAAATGHGLCTPCGVPDEDQDEDEGLQVEMVLPETPPPSPPPPPSSERKEVTSDRSRMRMTRSQEIKTLVNM